MKLDKQHITQWESTTHSEKLGEIRKFKHTNLQDLGHSVKVRTPFRTKLKLIFSRDFWELIFTLIQIAEIYLENNLNGKK